MESVPVGYLASALIPIAYEVGCWVWKSCNDLSNRRKLVLVLPRKAGKSSLNRNLVGASEHLMVVDLDEIIKCRSDPEKVLNLEVAEKKCDFSTSKVLKMEMVKDNVEYVKEQWLHKNRQNRALFLTSDIDVAKSIFKSSSICLAIPSDSLFKKMCEKLSKEDAEVLRVSRLNFLKSYNPDQYRVYNSFEGLNELVRNTYNLSYRA